MGRVWRGWKVGWRGGGGGEKEARGVGDHTQHVNNVEEIHKEKHTYTKLLIFIICFKLLHYVSF